MVFSLPFSYTDCADYLFVDRGAMIARTGTDEGRRTDSDGRKENLAGGEKTAVKDIREKGR